MISSVGNSGIDIFQQTTAGLSRGSAQTQAIHTLISLSNPTVFASPQTTTTTSGVNNMMDQLASEKESADSAEALLKEVYQRLNVAKSAAPQENEDVISQWKGELSSLKETQSGLSELEAQASTSASGRRIFNSLEKALGSAVSSLGQAIDDGPERGSTGIGRGERAVLSAITNVANLAQDLEQASFKVFQIQGAYGSAPGQTSSLDAFVYQEAQNLAGQKTGLVLDLVS
jgi:hypothetical protein